MFACPPSGKLGLYVPNKRMLRGQMKERTKVAMVMNEKYAKSVHEPYCSKIHLSYYSANLNVSM